jgi:starch phosphorylase
LTPQFSTNRAVREYTEQHYLPTASAYHARAANQGKVGAQIVNWQKAWKQNWSALHFGEVKIEAEGEQHVIEVQVYLDALDPEAVRVELYADKIGDDAPVRQEMQRMRQLVGATNGYAYRALVTDARPVTDYTVRVVPYHEAAAIPLENNHILWQR